MQRYGFHKYISKENLGFLMDINPNITYSVLVF